MATVESGYDLLKRGAFDDAVLAITKELEQAESTHLKANRALAYINLGKLDLALSDLESVDVETGARTDGHLQLIGVCYWLKGEYSKAINAWISGLDRPYSDPVGGVLIAALLHYAGVRIGRQDLLKRAKELLGKGWRSKNSAMWPGAIAGFLLEQLDERQLLDRARSRTDILEDRQLCQARFWIGVQSLVTSDLEKARTSFISAATSGMGFLEAEYYLAKGEISPTGVIPA